MTIGTLPDTPKYSIKTVCEQTGIRPVTLRAWERRYRLVSPGRTAGNYRLYSERDVALLRWLKRRVDDGAQISVVAAELAEIRRTGQWPEPAPDVAAPVPDASAQPPADYAAGLFQALIRHDEAAAAAVFDEVVTAFDMAEVCSGVLTPCLVAIGEGWARGEIRIATEHFASHYLRGRLIAIFQALPAVRSGPRVVSGTAQYELHDIASLMLAVLLRREGVRVEFFGADLHLGDLEEYARAERPALICLSAGTAESVRELRTFQARLSRMRPRPRFGFGGRSFNGNPRLQQDVPGVFLGETITGALSPIRQ